MTYLPTSNKLKRSQRAQAIAMNYQNLILSGFCYDIWSRPTWNFFVMQVETYSTVAFLTLYQ